MTRLLSSKAPAALLSSLTAGTSVTAEAAGGVEVERRVGAGEPVDLVVLASGAVRRLTEAGHVVGEPMPILTTDAVAAVRSGEAGPDLTSADALRADLADVASIGVSTGPSGDAVRTVLDGWDLADRLVTAPPGVPVGSLLTGGEVDLAFQQRTELEGLAGVDVVGPLPGPLALTTTFVGAVTSACADPEGAAAALADLSTRAHAAPSAQEPTA